MHRLAALCVLAVLGCSGGPPRRELLVFAASSLTESFRELQGRFEGEHPDVDVILNIAGSQILRVQLEQGAPADVFASANVAHLSALVAGGHVRASRPFAFNRLVVVVPAANPAGLRSFADLPRAERIVIGSDEVPVGAYAVEALSRADAALGSDFRSRVESRIVSREANTRLVLAKVQLGEADAAIVYETDAVALGSGVTTIPIPATFAPSIVCSIGVAARAAEPALAGAWVDTVFSAQGRDALRRRGFVLPPS